jgi:hypothetical protein
VEIPMEVEVLEKAKEFPPCCMRLRTLTTV